MDSKGVCWVRVGVGEWGLGGWVRSGWVVGEEVGRWVDGWVDGQLKGWMDRLSYCSTGFPLQTKIHPTLIPTLIHKFFTFQALLSSTKPALAAPVPPLSDFSGNQTQNFL